MARSTSKIIVMPKLGRVSRAARRPMHPTTRLWAAIGMIYLLFMLVGVIWSTFSNSLLCSYLDHLTVTGAMQRATDSFAAAFLKAAFPQLTLLILCCIFANSAVGTPFLLSILIFKAFFSGVFAAALVRSYQFKGFLCQSILFAPTVFLCGIALILIVSQGIRTSVALNSVVMKGKNRDLQEVYERFYHTVAVALTLSVAGGLAEAVLLRGFGKILL